MTEEHNLHERKKKHKSTPTPVTSAIQPKTFYAPRGEIWFVVATQKA
jgi:hypothetical protein